jgi:hypothetical protein
MKIWYVDWENWSCTWDTKEQAIEYVKRQVENTPAISHYEIVEDTESLIEFDIYYFISPTNTGSTETYELAIYDICHNESPFIAKDSLW